MTKRDACLSFIAFDPQNPGCHLGHGLDHCPGCEEYRAGMNHAERTRCEVWTRVIGYHRPVSAFNAGKQAEHAERLAFRELARPWPVGQFDD